MIKKFALIIIILLCYKTSHAQYLTIENLFESSLGKIDSVLVKHGFTLIEDGYNESDDALFYKGKYSNKKLSVFIRYTPYSKKVYGVTLLFDYSNYSAIKKYIQQKYNLKPIDSSQKYKRPLGSLYDIIYDLTDNIWIGLDNSKLYITCNEYHDLYLAETCYPMILKKNKLKKWQRKYKNPLFYDENPVVK